MESDGEANGLPGGRVPNDAGNDGSILRLDAARRESRDEQDDGGEAIPNDDAAHVSP